MLPLACNDLKAAIKCHLRHRDVTCYGPACYTQENAGFAIVMKQTTRLAARQGSKGTNTCNLFTRASERFFQGEDNSGFFLVVA